jgi:hypothetical protein
LLGSILPIFSDFAGTVLIESLEKAKSCHTERHEKPLQLNCKQITICKLFTSASMMRPNMVPKPGRQFLSGDLKDFGIELIFGSVGISGDLF